MFKCSTTGNNTIPGISLSLCDGQKDNMHGSKEIPANGRQTSEIGSQGTTKILKELEFDIIIIVP